jgi:hypothetical protein
VPRFATVNNVSSYTRRAGGIGDLLSTATSQLGGIAPYHWWDFIANRALFASADVGGVASTPGWSYTRADAQTAYAQDSAGNLIPFATGVLRRTDKGVLIEGARTNLCLWSNDVTNAAWQPDTTTKSVPAGTAPDGASTINRFEGTGSGTNYPRQSYSLLAATTYTWTFYVKSYGSNPTTLKGAVFNGVSWSVGSAITLTTSWQRVTYSFTTGSAGTYLVGWELARAATSGFDWAFAQLEAAAFPSSYVPTTSAASTRNADVLTVSSPGVTYPLSLFAEFERVVDTGGGEYALTVSSGTAANAAVLFVSGATDVARVTVDTASVRQADITSAATIPLATPRKMAARVATNSVQLALAGVVATEDTVVTAPSVPSVVRFGESQPFGYLRRCAVVSSAVNDAGLQAMTT